MKAKTYMMQIKKIDSMIENKMFERDRLKSIAMRTTSAMGGERVQTSRNGSKMEDAIVQYVDLETEIDREIDRLVAKKREVIEVIEQLDAVEYDILHKIYIQYMQLYDVADEYNRTYSWVTSVHGRALKNVQRIIDEREEEK